MPISRARAIRHARSLRRAVFGHPMRSLAFALGFAQAAIAHWLWVVAAGGESPGLLGPAALGLGLALANVRLMPLLRRARRRADGAPGRAARLYVEAGLATLLVGFAVAGSWLGLWPAAWGLTALGVDGDAALAGFRIASIGSVAAVAGMIAWGFTGGQARTQRTRLQIAVPGLPERRRGLRIVHLTDLHIGNGLEGERLDRLVARANALEPDLIALTGDIFDFDPRFVEDGARRLAGLRARLGVFGVTGNHDLYTGEDVVVDAIAAHAPGLRMLRGEVVRLPGEGALYVAGVDDPGALSNWTDRNLHLEDLERIGDALPTDGPTVLLVHRPEAFAQAARLGLPLVLAGHTHGGQIALPTPGGHFNPARMITPYYRGLYRHGDSQLYVSRGVGVAGPAIRFNCTREIAILELVPEPASPARARPSRRAAVAGAA